MGLQSWIRCGVFSTSSLLHTTFSENLKLHVNNHSAPPNLLLFAGGKALAASNVPERCRFVFTRVPDKHQWCKYKPSQSLRLELDKPCSLLKSRRTAGIFFLRGKCSSRGVSVMSPFFHGCSALNGSRLPGRLSSEIISLPLFSGFFSLWWRR